MHVSKSHLKGRLVERGNGEIWKCLYLGNQRRGGDRDWCQSEQRFSSIQVFVRHCPPIIRHPTSGIHCNISRIWPRTGASIAICVNQEIFSSIFAGFWETLLDYHTPNFWITLITLLTMQAIRLSSIYVCGKNIVRLWHILC